MSLEITFYLPWSGCRLVAAVRDKHEQGYDSGRATPDGIIVAAVFAVVCWWVCWELLGGCAHTWTAWQFTQAYRPSWINNRAESSQCLKRGRLNAGGRHTNTSNGCMLMQVHSRGNMLKSNIMRNARLIESGKWWFSCDEGWLRAPTHYTWHILNAAQRRVTPPCIETTGYLPAFQWEANVTSHSQRWEHRR